MEHKGYMGVRRSWHQLLELPSGRGLVAIPFVLIVTITVLDIYTGRDVQLGPLLVIAPALTASLAGTRLTALAGVLAVAAQVFIVVSLDGLTTPNRLAQIIALTVLSALVVFTRFVRERRDRALSLARSVAETAQRVLLRPPPRRIGPLQVAWLYMSAQDEAEIGGDLFAFARAAHAATRVVIGDVRGNGLAAIGEASLVLGAFREGAHRYATLPELVAALEDSVSRNLEDVSDTEHDPGEHFITCLVLEIPDDAPSAAEMINCGHPRLCWCTISGSRSCMPDSRCLRWACANDRSRATASTRSPSHAVTCSSSTPTESSKPARRPERSTRSPNESPPSPPPAPTLFCATSTAICSSTSAATPPTTSPSWSSNAPRPTGRTSHPIPLVTTGTTSVDRPRPQAAEPKIRATQAGGVRPIPHRALRPAPAREERGDRQFREDHRAPFPVQGAVRGGDRNLSCRGGGRARVLGFDGVLGDDANLRGSAIERVQARVFLRARRPREGSALAGAVGGPAVAAFRVSRPDQRVPCAPPFTCNTWPVM